MKVVPNEKAPLVQSCNNRYLVGMKIWLDLCIIDERGDVTVVGSRRLLVFQGRKNLVEVI